MDDTAHFKYVSRTKWCKGRACIGNGLGGIPRFHWNRFPLCWSERGHPKRPPKKRDGNAEREKRTGGTCKGLLSMQGSWPTTPCKPNCNPFPLHNSFRLFDSTRGQRQTPLSLRIIAKAEIFRSAVHSLTQLETNRVGLRTHSLSSPVRYKG